MFFWYHFPHLPRNLGWIRPIDIKKVRQVERKVRKSQRIRDTSVQAFFMRLIRTHCIVPEVGSHA